MNTLINDATKKYIKKNAPQLKPGYVVRVYEKIVEGGKERTQVFEGLVLSVKHGTGVNGMFTVRKIASGRVGVERTFPLHMPFLEKIEVLRQEKVRRAKLYFIREQTNKKTKKRKTQEKNLAYDLGALATEDISDAQEAKGTEEAIENSGDSEAKGEQGSEAVKNSANTDSAEKTTQAKADTQSDNTETIGIADQETK